MCVCLPERAYWESSHFRSYAYLNHDGQIDLLIESLGEPFLGTGSGGFMSSGLEVLSEEPVANS